MSAARRAFVFLVLLLVATFQVAKSSPGRPTQTGREQIAAEYGQLPLAFEANQGQTDARVKFLSRGSGYTLFLTPEEAVIELRAGHSQHKSRVGSGDRSTGAMSVLRMKLANGNRTPVIHGAEELPGRSNYFIGNDPQKWRSNVANYRKVKYEGVYPGVDLVYYGTQGQLEYDFVVAPGADPGRIALQFDGANAKLAANGDLLLAIPGGKNTPDGELCFHRPVVYQKIGSMRQPVDGSYKLTSANRVTFSISNYDRRRDLVIDPLLVYSTYLGGSLTNFGNAIAVDSAGSAYVTGDTISVNFPTKNPIEVYHSGGSCLGPPCQDVFVTKFNPAGSALVYSTYLGGLSADTGFGIAVDSAKNAYVVGRTYSNDFPTTAGVLRAFCGELLVSGNPTSTCNGSFPDAFVTKINAAGSAILYSTFLGGTLNDWATSVAVDSAGDAYVAGQTDSPLPTGDPNNPGFPVTGATAFQPKFLVVGGPYTSFFVKLNSTASSELYGTFFGSENPSPGADNSSQATGIAVDKSGKAYVSGNTRASDFPTTTGAFQTACAPLRFGQCASFRGFVAKFDPSQSQTASLVYSTYLGGTGGGADPANAIAVDSAGSAYVTGQAISADFPTTPGAYQTTCALFQGGCLSAYVTKFNPTGTGLVYSTLVGGQIVFGASNDAFGLGIRVDAKKNAYITGGNSEAGSPIPSFPLVNPVQTFGGAFVSELNPKGSALLFSTLFGSPATGFQSEHTNGIAVDSKGSVYVVGQTSLLTFTTTTGSFQTASGGVSGTWQAFVTKIATVAADLAITNGAPANITSGSNLTYTIVATNDGPDTATTVSVTDKTPTGTTFQSVSTTVGSCTAPAVGATGTVTCKTTSMANAASVTITLVVKVTALSGSAINDTASVTSATFDPKTANNTAKVKTTVQ